MNLHKAFFIDFQDDFAVFIFVVGIDGVRSVHALEVGLGCAGRKACLGPVFAFERINAGYNVFIGQEQAVE